MPLVAVAVLPIWMHLRVRTASGLVPPSNDCPPERRPSPRVRWIVSRAPDVMMCHTGMKMAVLERVGCWLLSDASAGHIRGTRRAGLDLG
ncbi:hypothetical protein AJ87_07170 [Rhizobium yanglingense]|nr:hypothetical protein AJ87_07170 [Rhizobium yanglingense]